MVNTTKVNSAIIIAADNLYVQLVIEINCRPRGINCEELFPFISHANWAFTLSLPLFIARYKQAGEANKETGTGKKRFEEETARNTKTRKRGF